MMHSEREPCAEVAAWHRCRTISLDSFGVGPSATSSIFQDDARHAAPFGLRWADQAFLLCERLEAENRPGRGNQELRFRGCTLRG